MLGFYSTADEIESGNTDMAVISIGSIEQHGPHLPIATDFIIAGSVRKICMPVNMKLLLCYT